MNSMTLNKIAAAVLLAGVVAMTTGFVTRLIHPAAGGGHSAGHGDEKRVLAAYVKEDGADAGGPAKPTGPEPIVGLLAAADVAAGEAYFKKRCTACHVADKGGPNKVGPGLYGIVGNDIAAHDGFKYTDALTGLPGNWTYQELNKFLFKPKAYAKGTKMAYAGIKKPADRADVIAFLRSMDDAPEALPDPNAAPAAEPAPEEPHKQ